jgi:hypothetical protein
LVGDSQRERLEYIEETLGYTDGIGAVFRTLSMVLVIPIAIFTTDVNRMVIGMVKLRIPYKITFVFSSTLRFFPVLFEEIGKNRSYVIGFRNYEVTKLSHNYSDVQDAMHLGLFNTGGNLEIAINKGAEGHGGSASTLLGLREDEIITVTFKK